MTEADETQAAALAASHYRLRVGETAILRDAAGVPWATVTRGRRDFVVRPVAPMVVDIVQPLANRTPAA